MIIELQKAKNLVDYEHYEQAISILNNLDDLSPKDERYKLLLLAYSFYYIEKYNLAIDITDQLLQMSCKNEYASQIKYLSYCGLEDYDNALNEIIHFLSHNSANLYKVTLEELLLDIKRGTITETIAYRLKELALKNNVSI